ncbi:MAG: VTT domain-containing protein [Acidobacteria bacterium]|nr:VTT domain-containing protein [Acidobacteriota bacterium]
MENALEFLGRYGYTVLFVFVLAEQIGLPIPALPILLTAGALAGLGRLSLLAAIIVAVLAALAGDALWYGFGRVRGRSVLNLVCRVSLEPGSCIRRSQDGFARHGPRILLFAKFVPGLCTAAPPLVAVFRMPFLRFLLWDAAGALLWAGSLVGAGYLFRTQLEDIALFATRLGIGSIILLGSGLAVYVASRYIGRRRFLRGLRTRRITPVELMRKVESAEDVIVADLRHALDLDIAPVKIPGAIRILPDELARRHQELPRDRNIVLYCSCPNEATSVHMALELRRRGIVRVHPLAGGFQGWQSEGFPVEPIVVPSVDPAHVRLEKISLDSGVESRV